MPEEKPAKGRVEAISDRFWSLAKLAGVVLLVGFFVLELARESLNESIRLNPVTIKVTQADDAPTSEMATQQILAYLTTIQSSGAHDWHQFRVDEQTLTPQSLSEITIQIPGSSFTLGSVVREVASFLPNRHQSMTVSITPGLGAAEYAASVTTNVRGQQKQVTCKSSDRPAFGYDRAKALDAMFECLAIEAMKSIDLLYVTSYVLALETKECTRFSAQRAPADVLAEDVYIEALRASCGFPRTRDLVAMIVARGNDDDAHWISYFYGKLRRARADALEDKDPDAQWFELDRAVLRFGDLPNVGGGPALAIKMGAYVDKAVFLHKAVWRAGDWKSVKTTQQLDAAEDILVSADRQLWSWRVRYPIVCFLKDVTSFPGWTPETNSFQKSAESVALMPYQQGQIKYRLWMINKDRSDHNNFRAHTSPEQQKALEGNLLRDAANKFAVAYCSGLRTAELFMNWGNALTELGQFDDAIDKFRRAGEVAPDDDGSALNIALALLRKAADRKDVDLDTRAKDRFEAVRAAADHLSWSSTGGAGRPYQNLIERIAATLDDGEKASFKACTEKPLSEEARRQNDAQNHLTRAQVKICVDALRDRMASGSVPEAYKLSR